MDCFSVQWILFGRTIQAIRICSHLPTLCWQLCSSFHPVGDIFSLTQNNKSVDLSNYSHSVAPMSSFSSSFLKKILSTQAWLEKIYEKPEKNIDMAVFPKIPAYVWHRHQNSSAQPEQMSDQPVVQTPVWLCMALKCTGQTHEIIGCKVLMKMRSTVIC